MAIRFRENQYLGVNAHLQSHLQQTGWMSFHNRHIIYITDELMVVLPKGYYALNEESLQVTFMDTESGYVSQGRTYPDVAVYQDSTPYIDPAFEVRHTSQVATPTITYPLPQFMDDPQQLDSIVISQKRDDDVLIPVTRIELLSPANKRGGSNYASYFNRRQETLLSGIRLVEIDYLHESEPILPNYEGQMFPYWIIVSDPLPNIQAGQVRVYGFRVNEPIPTFLIPLAGDDQVALNLDAVYQKTFENNPYYGDIVVDYEALPVNFVRYSEEDQRQIQHVMEEIKKRTQ